MISFGFRDVYGTYIKLVNMLYIIYIYMTQIAAILLLHGQMARVGPESFKGFAWDTRHFNALQRCKRKMPNGSNQKLSSTNLLPITSQYH